MKTSLMTAIPAILMLSACGGSGGSGEMTSGPLSVDEVGDIVVDLGGDIALDVDADNFTLPTEVPSSTTLEYEGFIAIGQTSGPANDPTSAIGTVELSLDLGANTISGEATNFYDRGAVPLVGTIPLENGVLVGDNLGSDTAAIQGLEFQSTSDNPLTRNDNPFGWGLIVLEGSLFGDSGEYVSATGTRITSVGGSDVEITAAIGAEQQ